MEQLWSPWRMAYLEGEFEPDPSSARCFLCAIGDGTAKVAGMPAPADDDAEETGVVWRGERVYALLNAFPYANGHLMVAPYDHVADLDRLDADIAAELMLGVQLMVRGLRAVYDPEGYNVGANLGTAAGAGFGDHLHFHVVPRWPGDTNFMTTVGGSRVIPEQLDRTCRRLRRALREIVESEA